MRHIYTELPKYDILSNSDILNLRFEYYTYMIMFALFNVYMFFKDLFAKKEIKEEEVFNFAF